MFLAGLITGTLAGLTAGILIMAAIYFRAPSNYEPMEHIRENDREFN